MMIIDNVAAQIDDLLDKMAEEVQLDDTRHARMKSSYEAIKNWIESDELFFKPYSFELYPHGSVRILTTVKPISKEEFDLDIAIHFKSNMQHSPQKIYNELKRRISENDRYIKMMELKNRCIRINYAGDFHIDILPGIQENPFDNNKMRVPDRELGSWVSSNPRGYANWFIEKSNLVSEKFSAKAALRAEKLPIDNFKIKKPLQRAVQLIKRYRDVYFQNDDTYKTSSIILTTMAGQFYQGEESIFKAIDNIITTINNKIDQPYGRLKITNPVNQDEDFTDKWDKEPEYYDGFKKFVKHLYSEWQKLKIQNGVLEEGVVMKGLFGDEVFRKAQFNQTVLIDQLRNAKTLGVSRESGSLTSASLIGATAIKNNTFYGN